MIDVNKLKVGVTFADEGSPWKVMKYDFIKMGRGGGGDQGKGQEPSFGLDRDQEFSVRERG